MDSARTEIEQNEVNDFSASESNLNDYISIPQFYTDRSVFITGGTGFVGKVLVEKLLRSCPGIKHIYLLIRPKRGQEAKARLNDLMNVPLFDTLRRERPNDLNKVIPIYGDITLEKLGISENDQALLCRTVSVVFHSAATVKFDEKLKLSVAINMLGTKRLVELCHRMMSLDALVHVSTAYCNCDRTEVSEVIYAPPYNPNDIISLVEWLPESMLDDLTPSLIGKRPNTYTFTKALAEHMLLNEAGNLPVAIVRPSIVLSSLNEPLPGWVDNYNGPTLNVVLQGTGLVKFVLLDKSKRADFIPVDVVANLMVVSAWKLATTSNKNLIVYNCVGGNENPIDWGNFLVLCTKYIRKYPSENAFYYPFGIPLHTEPYYTIFTFLLHRIPSYLLDLFSWLTTGKRIYWKILTKYNDAMNECRFFSTRQWSFQNGNVKELINSMNSDDQKRFNINLCKFSWDKYIENYVLGFRTYLLKQSIESLPKSRQKIRM
ncbi:putative fatty acyl-CoA reductase CG5065 [Lutzomyia longipalpis]|uniref:putative fatty acyl-CoA reductase CG5065 n=1 Tax=Lutzomyia longipalpis TaxID=7200 RepID=UPI0024843207|nr:putative fatty acyl-CoA reductase CG5065 [Lutzomyia longipalpis]